jgi:hypothetical protein
VRRDKRATTPIASRRTERWLSVDAADAEVFAFEELLDAASNLRGADAAFPHAAKGRDVCSRWPSCRQCRIGDFGMPNPEIRRNRVVSCSFSAAVAQSF